MKPDWKKLKPYKEGDPDRLHDNQNEVLVTDGESVAVAYHDGYNWCPAFVDSGYDMSEASLTFKPTHYAAKPEMP